MNKVLMSLLFSGFLLTGISFAQTSPPAAPPAAPDSVAVPVAVKTVHHEHHSEIHKAMRSLRAAKSNLEKAAHDYGGHKVKAIEAINEALTELKAALDFDKS